MPIIKMTTGLECFIPTGNGELLALVKAECVALPSEEVMLTALSGRTLAAIPRVSRVKVSREEWEDRPTDPYDSTVEATWALGKLGLSSEGADE